jgi:diguanylate cyclase (GGDEF)-like protein
MAETAISGAGGAARAGAHRPESSKRGRLRRQMYLAQFCSYLVDAAVLLLYYFAGTTSFSTAAGYLAAGSLWTGIVLALSEAHFNDRFRDHYLTVPQSMSSITIQLGAIYLAPEVGFYFACIIFIVLGFGALRMSAQQTGIVWAYAAFGLTVIFALTDKPIAMPMGTFAERQLALLCFVTALGRCAFTGLYGTSLREALYKRSNELKAAQARIEALAQIDELTGLNNRRSIMRMLNDEIARAQRSGAPCSVAIIDLDHFKRINDGFGHLVGDEALRRFAQALTANLRAVDKLGRYGGEEFLLILPSSGKDQALLALDRLRQAVADLDWSSVSKNLRVTMSAGVTHLRLHETPEEALSRADAALYRAKDGGRNCVVLA